MVRGGGRGGHGPHPRRLIDLGETISLAEKKDLLTLVSAITDRQHNDISTIFDSPPVSPVDNTHGHHHWLALPLLCKKESKLNIMPSVHVHKTNSTDNTYAKTHDIIEKEEKQAMTPQLSELKKEALAAFKKWQTLVLQRLRDITVNDPQSTQTVARGRGRGGRGGGGFRGRGGRGGGIGRGGLTIGTGPPRIPTKPYNPELLTRHPPVPNALWLLELERRKLLFHIVLLSTVALQDYSANSYHLLLSLATSLNLSLGFFQQEELRLADGLAQAALAVSEDELALQKAEESKLSRKWKNHYSASGTLVSGLTDVGIGREETGHGLSESAAARLLGPMSENPRSLTNFFGMNPSRPTQKMIDAFIREIQDFGLMPVHGDNLNEYCDARQTPAHDRRLRVVLAMCGWVAEDGDVVSPWKCLGRQTESFSVRWDIAVLSNLGSSLETVIKSSAWSTAKNEIATKTIFSCLIESKWPISLLKISKIMDNPWSVGMVRAEKAGAVLADAIMRHKFQGERPVSLIGYSLAARAIYACLMVLAERRQFGIIDNVVIMGAPVPSESRVWLTLKSVVSGRLVNVYSEEDYLLGFLCRFSNIHFGIAGLQDIQGADGVENYNVGRLNKGHLEYQTKTRTILENIGWAELEPRPAEPVKAAPANRPKGGKGPTGSGRPPGSGRRGGKK